MNTIIYYCNYIENGALAFKCGTSFRNMAEIYAKNLSYKHGRVTVTANYMNGGFKKIGFAENGKFFTL